MVENTIINALDPRKAVALTFDDGPGAHTLEIATYLATPRSTTGWTRPISATFFVVGSRVAAYDAAHPGSPPILEQLVALGHRVANHTYNHQLLDEATTDVVDQVRRAEIVIDPFISDGVYALRPPGLKWSDEVANTIRLQPALDKLVGPINWTFANTTYEGEANVDDVHCWPRVDGQGHNQCAPCDQCNPCAQGAQCDQCALERAVDFCATGYLKNINSSTGGIVLIHDFLEVTADLDYQGPLLMVKQIVEDATFGPGIDKYRFVDLTELIPIGGPLVVWSHGTDFSNTSGTGLSYRSIDLADVNADGRADICGRDAGGIVCALSNGSSFDAATRWLGTEFTDAQGWSHPKHNSTIQFGDINGDGRADVCGRGVAGMICATASTNGQTFVNLGLWSTDGGFSDAAGFENDSRYQTIRLADVNADGAADVCGRYPDGIRCSLSTRSSFVGLSRWSAEFADSPIWNDPSSARTIQLGDLNGDGRADVCGRSASGVTCATASTTSSSFGPSSTWSVLESFIADDNVPMTEAYGGAFRLADVSSDGLADACIRSVRGFICALSNGESFTSVRPLIADAFTDEDGWNQTEFGATISTGDVDGDGEIDVCGRGFGAQCWGAGRSWSAPSHSLYESASVSAELGTPASADFNHDGNGDVAAFHEDENFTSIRIAYGKPAYGFQEPVRAWQVPSSEWSVARSKSFVGDFDDDGKTDVGVLYNYESATTGLWVFWGTETGVTPPTRLWLSGPGQWAWESSLPFAADLDGVGGMEIGVLYDYGGNTTGILRFQFNGRSVSSPSLVWQSGAGQLAWTRSRVTAGDFTGDEKSDVALLYDYGSSGVALLTLESTGSGFASPVLRWLSAPGGLSWSSTEIVSARFDSDAGADVALLIDDGTSRKRLRVFYSSASGFQAPVDQLLTARSSGRGTRIVPVGTGGNARVGILHDEGANTVSLWEMNRTAAGFAAPARRWTSGSGQWSFSTSTPL